MVHDLLVFGDFDLVIKIHDLLEHCIKYIVDPDLQKAVSQEFKNKKKNLSLYTKKEESVSRNRNKKTQAQIDYSSTSNLEINNEKGVYYLNQNELQKYNNNVFKFQLRSLDLKNAQTSDTLSLVKIYQYWPIIIIQLEIFSDPVFIMRKLPSYVKYWMISNC